MLGKKHFIYEASGRNKKEQNTIAGKPAKDLT